jgi:MFS family permease
MVETTLAPAVAPAGGGRFAARRLVAGLALTQTAGCGVLYYSFPVLLTPIAGELHTSTATVTVALTISIVVAAVAAIPLGQWLARRGGRVLMTAGSLLGVVAVVAWSQVQQVWQLYAVFVLIGLAGAASLYEAAFPVVIAAARPGQRNSDLLTVTIVAGFASSIFFPLTGLLLAQVGWRNTLLALAGLLAPLHPEPVPSPPSLLRPPSPAPSARPSSSACGRTSGGRSPPSSLTRSTVRPAPVAGRQHAVAERFRAGRVVLVGDAARVGTAGRSGLNLGLRGAANLAWKLAADLRGHAPDDLLDTYEAEASGRAGHAGLGD